MTQTGGMETLHAKNIQGSPKIVKAMDSSSSSKKYFAIDEAVKK